MREQKGLTQADIANELGVTPAAVSKWENGSSKPRVEVLFRLAEILGVRPEELMAGKHLGETLDPEAVKRINERYEYLCKIDSYATTNVKLRRIAAWIIDWNITGLVTTVLWSILVLVITSLNLTIAKDPFVFTLALLTILTYPICFILRDLICGGRSLGKQMLGLTVLDQRTAGKTNWKQRIVRNIFSVFLMQIDVVVMFIRGESIGDTLAHTAVVLKKDVDTYRSDKAEEIFSDKSITSEAHTEPEAKTSLNEISKINSYKGPSPITKKTVIITVIALVLSFIMFFVLIAIIVSASLKNETKTPEYQIAYDYLISSQAFQESGKSEDDIVFNSYSYNSTTDINGNIYHVKEFGFKLGFLENATVICHKDGETWYVCEDCTKFK